MIDLSIIILSYNTRKLTIQCIESILSYTKGISFEIIIIDNASGDDSLQYLKKYENKGLIRLIKNRKNTGFGPGNNQGMKIAKGRYLLVLNSDTEIHDNVLAEMIEWMDNHVDAGIASCALKNSDGSYQGSGGYFPTLPKIFAWMFFIDDLPIIDRLIKPFHPMHALSPFYKGKEQYGFAKEYDWLTGAFLLIRKKVFSDTGGFNREYFMYTEDTDFCFRAKMKGWKVHYLPQWSITHYGGASSAKGYPIISEYKGVMTFYRQHYPKWQSDVLRLLLKGGAFLRMIMYTLAMKKKEVITYGKAFTDI